MSERHCRRPVAGRLARRSRGGRRDDRGDRFVLLGLSQGGALAVDYAVRHPERVSHLVLFNAYAQGGRARARTDAERLEAETLVNFVRIGWGRENPAFCQFFTNLFIPDGTAEQHRWWGDLERETASARGRRRDPSADAGDRRARPCAQVRVPTLILPCRGDMRVPFEEGASLRRQSRARGSCRSTAPITCSCRTSRPGRCSTPSWPPSSARSPPARPVPPAAGLTPAEAEVLRLVAEGLDNRSIAGRLGKSEKTVRNQVSVIFDKLGVQSRAQAIVRALGTERASTGHLPYPHRIPARHGTAASCASRAAGVRLALRRRRVSPRGGSTMPLDETRLERTSSGQVLGDLGGAVSIPLVRIGDALGLYGTLDRDRAGDAGGPGRGGRLRSALRARMALGAGGLGLCHPRGRASSR